MRVRAHGLLTAAQRCRSWNPAVQKCANQPNVFALEKIKHRKKMFSNSFKNRLQSSEDVPPKVPMKCGVPNMSCNRPSGTLFARVLSATARCASYGIVQVGFRNCFLLLVSEVFSWPFGYVRSIFTHLWITFRICMFFVKIAKTRRPALR